MTSMNIMNYALVFLVIFINKMGQHDYFMAWMWGWMARDIFT